MEQMRFHRNYADLWRESQFIYHLFIGLSNREACPLHARTRPGINNDLWFMINKWSIVFYKITNTDAGFNNCAIMDTDDGENFYSLSRTFFPDLRLFYSDFRCFPRWYINCLELHLKSVVVILHIGRLFYILSCLRSVSIWRTAT